MEINKSKVEKKDAEPLKINRYSVFDWFLDFENQQFGGDDELVQWLLLGVHTKSRYESGSVPVSQLFSLIPSKQRKELVKTCHQVLNDGESRDARVCVLPGGALMTYVELVIHKHSEHVITGTLQPCLTLNTRQELASIFLNLFDNDHHGLILTDNETRILTCNQYFEKSSGYKRHELLGLKTNIFNADKHSEDYFSGLWAQISKHGYWNGSMLSRRANGSVYPQELTIQRVVLDDGRDYYLGMSVDISEHLDRIEDNVLGGVDLLTQLPTKEVFIEQLESICRRKEEDQGVMVLSIQPSFDEFTEFQQKAEFGLHIQKDTTCTLAGYLGENHYVIALTYPIIDKKPLVTSIRKAISQFLTAMKLESFTLYRSVMKGLTGVSILGVDAKSPRMMFSHANQAVLEMPISSGRNIGFYDTHFHAQVERKKSLEDQVTMAIKNRDVEVHFQPIVDIKQWKVDKFESLCRFPSIKEPSTNVEELISLAEDMGLINELDSVICQLSVKAIPELKAIFGAHVGVTINRSLHTEGCVIDVLTSAAEIIQSSGVNSNDITLEITERAYFDSEEQCAEALQILRSEGITIAIDDFGTGYSSFHYLHHCHFDVLKIDRLFVSQLKEGSNQYFIVKALTELSHQLGLKVIAEGVETEEELQVLRSLKVDSVQGYLFAPAMSIEQLKSLDLVNDFKKHQGHIGAERTVMKLASSGVKRVDSGEPISTVYQYLQEPLVNLVAVVVDGECVGLVDREHLNLHLTPTMATDRESSQEAERWKRPTYQVMHKDFATVNWNESVNSVIEMLTDGKELPWVVEDDHGRFKGVIEENRVLHMMLEQHQ